MAARHQRWSDRTTESARARLELLRSRSALVDAAARAVQRDSEVAGRVLGAALAFRIFLLLIPYTFLVVVALDLAGNVTGESPATVARKAGVAGIAAAAVSDTAQLSGVQRLLASGAALIAVVLAARRLLAALATVHSLVWRMGAVRRSPGLGQVLLFVAGISCVVASITALGWLRQLSAAAGLAATLLFGVVPALMWLLLALHLPRPPQLGAAALLPGAALVAAAASALHVGTVYWVAHQVAVMSDQYGAIGVALALLLWAYAFGRILIGAAVVTTATAGRHPAG